MPHESWLATELLLFAFFVALLVIAAMSYRPEDRQ